MCRRGILRQRRAEFKELSRRAQEQQHRQQHRQHKQQRRQHKQLSQHRQDKQENRQNKQEHRQHRQQHRQHKQLHREHRQTRCALLWLGLLLSHCSNSEGAVLRGGLQAQGADTRLKITQDNKKVMARPGTQEPGVMGQHGQISTEIMVGTSEQEPD